LKFFSQNNYTEKTKILYFLNLVYFLSLVGLWQNHMIYLPLTGLMSCYTTPFTKRVVNKYRSQGSRWRAIQVKKSPCEGWLCFLVGQKRSSSRLVILKSRPMSPASYFLHLSICISIANVNFSVYLFSIDVLKFSKNVYW